MEFQLFVDALLSGTPIAILAAMVGLVWQLLYVRSRDRLQENQMKREMALEEQKFRHSKELEQLRFEYEQRQWREELSKDMILKVVEVRIDEYSRIWRETIIIATTHSSDKGITKEKAKALAEKIKVWRYDKGGLLAERITRDIAYDFQRDLFDYDETKESLGRVTTSRMRFLKAIRADMGLATDAEGNTIFQNAERRQNIRRELKSLQEQIKTDSDT